MKRQKKGEKCGNCVETADPNFSGCCTHAGEISSEFWCEHYEKCTTLHLMLIRQHTILHAIADSLHSHYTHTHGGHMPEHAILEKVFPDLKV